MSQINLVKKIRQHMATMADKTALRNGTKKDWIDISWSEFQQQTDELSSALVACGLQEQENVGIFANNCARWSIADLAILQNRAVSVPIYPTNTPKQTAYIINDAQIKILFVGEQAQFNAAALIFDQCDSLEKIVAMDDKIDLNNHSNALHWHDFVQQYVGDFSEVEQRIKNIADTDLLTIIYTSGTTGDPKGVMLDYSNIHAQLHLHDIRISINEDDVSLCFLPLSHVFERAWTFFVLYKGATNCYLSDTNLVKRALEEIKPTVMCAVPRFYEKIYSTVFDKVSRAPMHRKIIFTWAVNMGAKVALAKQQNKPIGKVLAKCYQLADKMVLNKLRQVLGGNIKMMPCGGAKLDPIIGRFFQAIGINIKLGYGMTETAATVSCWDELNYDPESVGSIMPGVEIKIGAQDEILVKGPMVMKGYYNKPEETAKTFDHDGFLKTGDAGHFKNGNLYITDRIKELMKTSGGKYIAPQMIEGALGKDHFIEQIVVIADTKKFVSALIVPCYEVLEEYSKELNIKYNNRMDLIKNSHIIELFEKRLADLQDELAKFEQVKKFTLLSKNFSMEKGEMTPTQKLRRKVINERYKNEIDKMYGE
ncbi:long-chain fatty acid--CoA ligase [Thalassotalea aquiviva]|uniref:AMP-dependent synthetase/ligase n=1 Tax=Thalassotalea aquiviva TaxID=3242415 RepID=UPI00352A9C37